MPANERSEGVGITTGIAIHVNVAGGDPFHMGLLGSFLLFDLVGLEGLLIL